MANYHPALKLALCLSAAFYLGCNQEEDGKEAPQAQTPPTLPPPPPTMGEHEKEFLRYQAEEGVAGKQYKYAYVLSINPRDPSDLAVAKDYFAKEAANGHLEACFRLGVMLSQGTLDGIPDIPAAITWLERAAQDGHSGAQYLLGRLYLQSETQVNKNVEAITWLNLSAHQANPEAQFLLGRLHETGHGLDLDSAAAFEWYSWAARSGHPAAQYKVGMMLKEGVGTPKDLAASKRWLAMAAKSGILPEPETLTSTGVHGQSQVAVKEQSAQFVPSAIGSSSVSKPIPAGNSSSDPILAMEKSPVDLPQKHNGTLNTVQGAGGNTGTLQSSEEKEPEFASADSPQAVPSGQVIPSEPIIAQPTSSPANKIVPQPTPSAAKPMDSEKPSPANYTPAELHQFAMDLLEPPDGEVSKPKEALTLLLQAASSGNVPSQLVLGDIHLDGTLGAVDSGQAYLWYNLAARANNPEAQFKIGSMYLDGVGVGKDLLKAQEWLGKAAAQDDPKAKGLLQAIQKKAPEPVVSNPPSNDSETLKVIKANANAAIPGGAEPIQSGQVLSPQEWLDRGARIYNSGENLSVDQYRQAYQYFVRAAKAQHQDAWYYIGRMLDYGQGFPVNQEQAFKYYQVAAFGGNTRAQYNLGFFYEIGQGCQKNPIESYAWYALAAENGDGNAAQIRLDLENTMPLTHQSQAKQRLGVIKEYLAKYQQLVPPK